MTVNEIIVSARKIVKSAKEEKKILTAYKMLAEVGMGKVNEISVKIMAFELETCERKIAFYEKLIKEYEKGDENDASYN